jgi:hypothetical protein
MPDALEILLVIIAVLLWFIWKQLEKIALSLRGLYREATDRRDSNAKVT